MSDGPPVAQRDPTPHITPDEAIARCRQVLDAAWSLLGCLGGHIILRPGHRPEHTTAYYLDRLRADLAPLLTAPALRSSLLADVAQSASNLNDLLAELGREPGYSDPTTGEPTPPRPWRQRFREATARLRAAVQALSRPGSSHDPTTVPPTPAAQQERAVSPATPAAPSAEERQHVTLDQMAAQVNRSKKTLERLKKRKRNPLPPPDVEGGGGKPDEWLWSRVRPWLEEEYGRQLPERFPAWRPPA